MPDRSRNRPGHASLVIRSNTPHACARQAAQRLTREPRTIRLHSHCDSTPEFLAITGLCGWTHDGMSSVRAVAGGVRPVDARVIGRADAGHLPRGVGEGISNLIFRDLPRKIHETFLELVFAGRTL